MEFIGDTPACKYVSVLSKTGVVIHGEDEELLGNARKVLLADGASLYWSKLSNAAVPPQEKCRLTPCQASVSKQRSDGLVVMRTGERLELEIRSGRVGGYIYLLESTPGGRVRCRDFAGVREHYLAPFDYLQVRLPEMNATAPDEFAIFSLLISKQPLALTNFTLPEGPDLGAASFVDEDNIVLDPTETGPGFKHGKEVELRLTDLDPDSWDTATLFVNITN